MLEQSYNTFIADASTFANRKIFQSFFALLRQNYVIVSCTKLGCLTKETLLCSVL